MSVVGFIELAYLVVMAGVGQWMLIARAFEAVMRRVERRSLARAYREDVRWWLRYDAEATRGAEPAKQASTATESESS